jgi:hypothetical protein
MSRWARVCTVASLVAALVAAGGCAGRRRAAPTVSGPGGSAPVMPVGGGSMVGVFTLAERGEHELEALPWHPDVLRANLAVNGPVALTRVWSMAEDILVVDVTGRLYCLSKRDLSPRWISTLRTEPKYPAAESATHYVFLEEDPRGAWWVQWFSKRNGAEADQSPVHLPFAASAGISATSSTAYLASLGSPIDNKTIETVDLLAGTLGWGYRTHARVTATPSLDPAANTLLVLVEDGSVVGLPANSAIDAPEGVQWETTTLASNRASPVITKDWAFVASMDNFLYCFDVHGGQVRWRRGVDAPTSKTPWVLGAEVVREVTVAGEGSAKVQVSEFQGWVFAKNELGLHCLDAATGAKVFLDPSGERPIVRQGEWVLTLDTAKAGVLRKGKGLAPQGAVQLGLFDFIPTNSRDGTVVAATADGVVLLAVPK